MALSASNATAATQQTQAPSQSGGNTQASIIMVEVLGYGGGGDQTAPEQSEKDKKRTLDQRQSYDPNSMFQIVGGGTLSEEQKNKLTDSERSMMSVAR